jgi:predicted membrane-bound mannosyltransferase
VAKIHRLFGYLMLFIGNACIMTGVGHYYGDRLKNDERRVLGVFSFFVFCFLVIIFEGIFRVRNKYSMGHIVTPKIENTNNAKLKTFTASEIDE